jgi:BolA family transcriptional regulator, general stress-responsive regulator
MNYETPPLVSPLAATARPAALLALLEAAFGSGSTVVVDDSHHHVGHATAGGAGHFSVRVVSDRFVSLRTLARHRLVYTASAPLMPQDIHALSITALTPAESTTG